MAEKSSSATSKCATASYAPAAPVMPAMLTLDERVIRQDCLCYFMERLVYER